MTQRRLDLERDGHRRDGGARRRLGQELNLNNIKLDFDFATFYGALRLLFAELGGNDHLEVDGDFRNVADLVDPHGMTMGGAQIFAIMGEDGHGVLEVRGFTSSFRIGGQELWIDDICIYSMLFGDGLESGNTGAWGVGDVGAVGAPLDPFL